MPMRLSGLMSGMDTETIISQLVEARKTKVTKAVKAQKSLKYKQDAWKGLNTQILNLYNKSLAGLRFESSFVKKTTKVSDSSVVSVITGENAMNGVQSLQVDGLAKTAFLTGDKLDSVTDDKGNIVNVTGNTEIGQLKDIDLGTDGTGSMTVEVNGEKTSITVGSTTTIDSFIGALRNAGLNANFDSTNQRIFISSKTSGKDNDFMIYGNDLNGLSALKSMGIAYKENDVISRYSDIIGDCGALGSGGKVQANGTNRLARRLENQLKSLTYSRSSLQSGLGSILEGLGETDLNAVRGRLGSAFPLTQTVTVEGEDGTSTTKQVKIGEKGFDYTKLSNAQWGDLNSAVQAVFGKQASTDAETKIQERVKAAEEALANAQAGSDEQAVKEAEAALESVQKAAAGFKEWESGWKSLGEINNRLAFDAGGLNVTGLSADEKADVTKDVQTEYDNAKAVHDALTATGASFPGKKTAGEDASIRLNGVVYTSSKNTFEINSLTLTVSATTAATQVVTITTEDDTNGVYDMVRNFFKEYNTVINQMDKYYNADSAKGYDPLTDEEKEAMSDSAIEDWENKIKDSILRRDSTLGFFSSEMKRIMMEGVEVNGKKMYLSNFGIGTLSYFIAPENERNAYHIDGDPDDASTSGNADKLKSMIANDSETVVSFFTKLSKNLYDKMFDMMKGTENSSAFTAYEDKKMKEDYDDYTVKIKELEKKLADYEDKWYAKFAAMETALAKMQEKTSAVTSLLGG